MKCFYIDTEFAPHWFHHDLYAEDLSMKLDNLFPGRLDICSFIQGTSFLLIQLIPRWTEGRHN